MPQNPIAEGHSIYVKIMTVEMFFLHYKTVVETYVKPSTKSMQQFTFFKKSTKTHNCWTIEKNKMILMEYKARVVYKEKIDYAVIGF